MKESVKRIFENSTYCVVATVCENGSPWNVPVRFAYDEAGIYFRSPAGTMHGSNIERDGRIAVVVFDTSQSVKGAVYLHSCAHKLVDSEEVDAKRVFNMRFGNPLDQWERTEYFKVEIGELDTARTIDEMYYFHTPAYTG